MSRIPFQGKMMPTTRPTKAPLELELAPQSRVLSSGMTRCNRHLSGISKGTVIEFRYLIRAYGLLIGVSRHNQAIQMMREIESAGTNAAVTVFSDVDRCVDGADIVCTTTTSNVPVFNSQLLQNGCHINTVGSFTPAMQEIDSGTVRGRIS
jgi:hypothetical protein